MPYLELSLRCREAEQPRYERAFDDVGALAVTLLDADAETPNERAILEPGVGEMPIWGEVALTALFPHDADPLLLLSALEAFDPELDWSAAGFRKVEDEDWERAWMDQYTPLRFGERTWIVPWNQALPDEADRADAAVVRLDPGLAFGSGTHPTTALCLRWLDGLATNGELQGVEVLDFGCGSGILALAALKLGALADTLAARVAPGGRIALSGILHGQEDELLVRYGAWFDDLAVAREDDWVRIEGRRRR